MLDALRDGSADDRADRDPRMFDSDPGAGPEQLDNELAVVAEQVDEKLMLERQHGIT